MNAKVKIADIVEAFEVQDGSSISYVNIRTGEVETVSEEYSSLLGIDDDEEDVPEWLRNEYERYRRVTSSEDYVSLPSQYEIDEYRIMRSFADDREDPVEAKQLLQSMTGKGAFRRFKDTAFDLGVIDEWHRYRTEAFADIAREWCKENGFEFEDDVA